jgi:drug/metabolite transporter (DMT)-like permease
MLVTRQIAKDIDPLSLQASNGILGVVLVALLLWLFGDAGLQPLVIVSPTNREVVLMLTLGVLGTTAHLLMTWSLRYAPSATLAPMQYLEIPIATFIGWLVFRDLPDTLETLGILITIGSGLYVIYREQANARREAMRI